MKREARHDATNNPRQRGVMRDFFISYNKADVEWAAWIAHTLEGQGYTSHFQHWDFRPGTNFILAMNDAAALSRRMIAVLTPNYLASLFTQAEWSSVLARDPGGKNGTLLPVRVEHCELPPSFAAIAHCDLVGLNEKAARVKLLVDVKPRSKPSRKPKFPGAARLTAGRGGDNTSPRVEAARRLADILDTTRETFVAQVRVRDKLVDRMRSRLGIKERLEYEEFFQTYFRRMNSEERRLHSIIRGYTQEALREYNEQALQIATNYPTLDYDIPSLSKLRAHLRIWLAKYQAVFEKRKSMALLYVGVTEKAPFPSAIDRELRDYLKNPSKAHKRRAPKVASTVRRRGIEG